MKKIYLSACAVSALFGLFTSCMDLEPEDYSNINTTIFPQTEADAMALMTANVYATFRNNSYGGIFNNATGVQTIGEMTTDLGACCWGGTAWVPLQQHLWDSNHQYSTINYTNFAKDLGKMLLTQDRIKDIPMDENVKARFEAEIHLGRGWLGYLLWDFYGPVPLATLEELNNPLNDVIVPRASEDEMKSFIETELKAAIESSALPTKASADEYGRFDKGLAYTVLMKYYMEAGEWANAEACGRELMKPEYGYDLMEHYADIFTLENEQNKEIIFACVEQRGVSLQLWHDHALPGNYPVTNTAIQRWDGYKVPWAFYHTFESGDERLQSLVGEYVGSDGVEFNEAYDKTIHSTIYGQGAVPVKYGEDPNSTGDGSQIDWIVYRYADVLTLLAEAIVRNGNAVTQDAVDLLNKIRTRATLQPRTLSDYPDVQAFLDDVLLERGHELWWEGNRRTDLIRHGKFVQSAIDRGEQSADYRTRFAIPQSVINEGKGKIAQNEGY